MCQVSKRRPSGKKVKLNLPSAIELSETVVERRVHPETAEAMHLLFSTKWNGPTAFTKKDLIYHTLVMFYKIHSRNAPLYLTSLLPPLSLSSGYTFRKLSYKFPAVKRTSTMNSFLPRAVALWNQLPMDIQQSSSTFIFKKRLRTQLKL